MGTGERDDIGAIDWGAVEEFQRDQQAPPKMLPASKETLPLTPGMRAALRRRIRVWAWAGTPISLAVAAIGGWLFFLTVTGSYPFYLPLLALVLAALCPVWLVAALLMWSADLRDGVFVRAAGAIRIVLLSTSRDYNTGATASQYRVTVGEVSFAHYRDDATEALEGMEYGTVEFAPRSHTIFAIRDAEGRERYRYRWYTEQRGE